MGLLPEIRYQGNLTILGSVHFLDNLFSCSNLVNGVYGPSEGLNLLLDGSVAKVDAFNGYFYRFGLLVDLDNRHVDAKYVLKCGKVFGKIGKNGFMRLEDIKHNKS